MVLPVAFSAEPTHCHRLAIIVVVGFYIHGATGFTWSPGQDPAVDRSCRLEMYPIANSVDDVVPARILTLICLPLGRCPIPTTGREIQPTTAGGLLIGIDPRRRTYLAIGHYTLPPVFRLVKFGDRFDLATSVAVLKSGAGELSANRAS